jgi:hypothetical protein
MLEDGIPVAEIARWLGRSARYLREGLQARGRRTGTRWRSTARRHGKRLYGFWVHLRRKCEAPGHRDYARFGERGIRVCRAWHDFDAFYDWAMGAGYASGRRLERRSEARDFAPSNCRWVDAEEHAARHPRPATRGFPIAAFGERKGQCAWARDPRCRVKQSALRRRLAAGWPPAEAIASPPGAQPTRRVTPPARLRRRRVRRARIDWEEACRLHRDEGVDEDALARRYGATTDAVRRGLARRGVRRERPRTYLDRERARLESVWRNLQKGARTRAGGRRVRLAAEWRDFEAFLAWARESGARKGLWLALKSGRRVHSPGNCEWVSRGEATRRRLGGASEGRGLRRAKGR